MAALRSPAAQFGRLFCTVIGLVAAAALIAMALVPAAPAGAQGQASPTPSATSTRTSTAATTSSPTQPPVESCGPLSNYVVTQSTGPLVPGTEDLNINCRGCTALIDLPFPFTLYDREFTQARVSSSGNIQFVSNNAMYVNACLPRADFSYTIFASWENYLNTGRENCPNCGVYSSISGEAPNRIFNIEWRGLAGWPLLPVNFEVRLYEASGRFDLVYGQMDRSGTESVVGVQRGTAHYTQYQCYTGGLTPNLVLSFNQPSCPTATGTPPTATVTRTPTVTGSATPACGPGSNYVVAESLSNIVHAENSIGNHCDDCTTQVTLPFTYTLYGQPFTQARVSSNGTLQFTGNNPSGSSTCLPNPGFSNTIMPYWANLTTEFSGPFGCGQCGVFTSTQGIAPNRTYIIEWRANTVTSPPSYTNFEVILYEGRSRFDLLYGDINRNFTGYTVGAQRDTGSMYRQYSCDTSTVRYGTRLDFTQPSCGVTGTPTATVTGTPPTATPTRAPVEACGVNSNYNLYQTTEEIAGGTLDTGNHCEGCTTVITLPFTYNFYGQPFNTARVSSYGHLQFTSNVQNDITNSCIPNSNYNNVIFAHWAWMHTANTTGCDECGIFTSVSGTAPNRVLNIEWRTVMGNGFDRANFELRLHEANGRFDIVYGELGNRGRAAVVGAQRGTGTHFTQYICRTFADVIDEDLMLVFMQPECEGTPTATVTPGGPTLTPTATSIPTSCATNTDYTYTTSTATIVPGLIDTGNHCDSCFTNIRLPFTYTLYGREFTGANLGSDGTVQFNSNNTESNNSCLPAGGFYHTIFAHWDDLRTDSVVTATVPTGIYTSVTGLAPNRIFNIEWRACRDSSGEACPDTDTNFEVRLYERENRFDIVYGAVAGNGSGATIGVQRGAFNGTNRSTQFSCNTGSITPGLALHFSQQCGTPTPTPTSAAPGGPKNGSNGRAGLALTPMPRDAYAYFDGPGRVPAEQVGTPIAIELLISSEGYPVAAGQSYISFPHTILRVVDPDTQTCSATESISADTTIFDRVLQNEVCNGPGPCNFRGNLVSPGTIAFASGAYSNPAAQGNFHVARIHFCAVSQGAAVLRWQFSPDSPPNRSSAILGPGEQVASSRSLYTDFVLQIGNVTPEPSSTAAPTGTSVLPTSTVTATPNPSRSSTPVATRTTVATSIPTSTRMPSPVASGTPYTCSAGFSDVEPGSTFYPFVMCLACHNIISGYGDGTFRPGNPITRGQIAKVVSNGAGFNDPVAEGTQTFTDVRGDQTFWLWIERLASRGIMSGYPCGGAGEPCDGSQRPYFRPQNDATRGQLSKIVANAAGLNDPMPTEEQRTFEDVTTNDPFYPFIERLAMRGIMGGYPCGGAGEPCGPTNRPYFRSGNNVTRGQASKIVANTFYPNCAESPRPR